MSNLTSEVITSWRPTQADAALDVLTRAIAAERATGARYIDIATRHGKNVHNIRYHCRRAIKYGFSTYEALGMRPPKKRRPVIPDGKYNEHWLARVKARTVIDENGCWLWQGSRGTKRYGDTTYRRYNVRIHRKAYEIIKGVKLRTEEFVCHRCDVRHCWNIDHLFVGDAKVNNSDACQKGRNYEARRSHCERGHPLSGDNLRRGIAPNGNPNRHCKACQLGYSRIKLGWPAEAAYSLPAGSRNPLKQEAA